MNVQMLLSVVLATLAALGTLLLAMGQSNPWMATAMWLAALVALIVNDYKGWFRLKRNSASLMLVGVVLLFLPSCLRADGPARLFALANMLICLQVVLLFQERDERVYWWLAVMSLLEVVVAAGFNQGIAFGVLLVLYLLLGLVALALLALYGDGERFAKANADTTGLQKAIRKNVPLSPEVAVPLPRWPLAKTMPQLTSDTAAANRTGLVLELFLRLAMLGISTMILSMVLFFVMPRLGQSAWRGPSMNERQVVGYNDRVTLGHLGNILESREEVMQVRLQTKGNDQPLAPLDAIYLRGAVVTYYADNQWQPKLDEMYERDASIRSIADDWTENVGADVSTEVYQRTTLEPNLDHDDLCYIPPLLTRKSERVRYNPHSEALKRLPGSDFASRRMPYDFTIRTGGIAQGQQIELVPNERELNTKALLQMPPLPNLTKLAAQCITESRLKPGDAVAIARRLEAFLRISGKFKYSLQGERRDPHIDAIEDFVTKHPSGHCEYFATALALMLRSQHIPSRVALGYRCDEWDPAEKCYQVRQLHAHAWVEAFIGPAQIPKGTYNKNPLLWQYGGWLRLDPTPESDLGSVAADSSTWGRWQHWFSDVQHRWDKYIVEMNQKKQQEAIFLPLKQALARWFANVRDPAWWLKQFRYVAAGLRRLLQMGLLGVLLALATFASMAGLIYLATRYLLYPLGRRVMRWRGRAVSRQRLAMGSSIEFYRRFEQIAKRQGLVRKKGETPREFGQLAGATLAQRQGKSELSDLAGQIVERFYCVRYGGEPLDKSGSEAVEHALALLAAPPV